MIQLALAITIFALGVIAGIRAERAAPTQEKGNG
jgi:hypothetical protein